MATLLALVCLLLAASAATATQYNGRCDADNCQDYAMLRYYRELTCRPYNDTNECCPLAFNCSFLDGMDNNVCQYKGVAYEIGTIIYDEVDDPCAAECRCTETLSGASFECVPVVCPEAEVYGQLPPNCHLKFDATHCCATGFYCLPDGKGEVKTEPTMKCIYNGFSHKEGQYLTIKHPRCTTCVCEKGFDGTLNGPWCHKYTCDMLISLKVSHLKNCAPVFPNEFSCCPQAIHCPVGNDVVIPSATYYPPRDHGVKCSFGHLKLNVGDHLVSPGICVTCSCAVPPFVTCFSYTYEGCKEPDPEKYGGRRKVSD